MPKRIISIDVDFVKVDNMSKFRIKQFDNANIIVRTYNDSVPYNPKNSTCKLFVGAENEVYMQTKNITTHEDYVSINLDRNVISKKGDVYAELEFTDEDGVMTSATFIFEIMGKIGEGSTLPVGIEGFIEKYERLISEMKKQSENFETRFNKLTAAQQQDAEVIDARDGMPSLKSRLDYIETTKADNNAVFTMANMGQDIKEAMTGGAVAVIGRDSVLTENIVDKQVTPIKTTFFTGSNNLFDSSTVTEYKIVNASGEVVDSSSYFMSDYIKVNANTVVSMTSKVIEGYGFIFVACYDSEKNFIKRADLSNNRYTMPSRCNYIIVMGQLSSNNNYMLMVNNGEALLPYETPGGSIKSEYVDGHINRLIDEHKSETFNISYNLFNKNAMTLYKIVNSSGEVVDSDNYIISEFIEVKPTKVYAFTSETVDGKGFNMVAYYDKDKKFIERKEHGTNNFDLSSRNYSCRYVRMIGKIDSVVNQNIVLNEGRTLLPYVDYKRELSEMLSSSYIARDKHNNIANIIVSNGAKFPNINTANKTFTLYSKFYVLIGRHRYEFTEDVVLKLNSGHTLQYVVFNRDSQKFRVIEPSKYGSLLDEDYLVMILMTDGNFNVRDCFITCRYTINNSSGIGVNESVYFVDRIKSNYCNIQGEFNDFTYDTSINDYFSKLDALVDGKYITKEILGLDSSGTYNVYKYNLTPMQVSVPRFSDKKIPKILINCGIHGFEKASVFSIYYFIYNLVNNWQNDEILEYLRFNVEFEIIPVSNPWGYVKNSYLNANGVNINRNFEYGWVLEEKGDQYGGTEPFSEIETKYIKNMIDNNLDAIYYVDYHTQGNKSTNPTYDNLIWHSLCGQNGVFHNDKINIAAKNHIEKMSRRIPVNYNTENKLHGYISNTNGTGLSKSYGAQNGIISSTFEGFVKLPAGDSSYSNKCIKANTESLVNWLACVIDQLSR